MASAQTQFIQRTYQQPYRPAAQANSSVRGRGDSYNDFIWALARKFTNSRAEAAAAAQEMFEDIRSYSKSGQRVPATEDRLIAYIALRRLLKFLE